MSKKSSSIPKWTAVWLLGVASGGAGLYASTIGMHALGVMMLLVMAASIFWCIETI